jgi:hypothetical protein
MNVEGAMNSSSSTLHDDNKLMKTSLLTAVWAQHILPMALTMRELVKMDDLDLLKLAHQDGRPLDGDTCELAVTKGNLGIFKYAHENKCPWHSNLCFVAAGKGHLEILRNAIENSCPWSHSWLPKEECTTICNIAAEHGHLEVLKYLHQKGCPWGECTCTATAWSGNVEVLKYCHEHGRQWDQQTCLYAVLWIFYSMPMKMAVHGTKKYALQLLRLGVWRP